MALQVALVGCGNIGHRHIAGLRQLRRIGRRDITLVAVCDTVRAQAESAQLRAATDLDMVPAVFDSFDAVRRAMPGLDAVIVATSPAAHAEIGVAAFAVGMHALVEKPIALSMADGHRLLDAATRAGCTLAVAENYRRDPLNRLAKALLDSGLLGDIFLAVQSSGGSRERRIVTPWRDNSSTGGIIVDMGVHYTDLLEYFLGPLDEVVGMVSQVARQRRDTAGRWQDVDTEDVSAGVGRFRSGAMANWLLSLVGSGTGHFIRAIYGTQGSLAIPRDHSGRPLTLSLHREGGPVLISAPEQLGLVPTFALDATTAALFGGERLSSYELADADADANSLAIELADFADAIVERRAPEVTGYQGLRALAIVDAFLLAARRGVVVRVDDVICGTGRSA